MKYEDAKVRCLELGLSEEKLESLLRGDYFNNYEFVNLLQKCFKEVHSRGVEDCIERLRNDASTFTGDCATTVPYALKGAAFRLECLKK